MPFLFLKGKFERNIEENELDFLKSHVGSSVFEQK